MKEVKFLHNRHDGSALILAVVLTSLLAVIGAMFLMTSRVERTATSAIQDNKELDSAVEAAISAISRELIRDFPSDTQEYYDYPDVNIYTGVGDSWLASLEPREDTSSPDDYIWPHITDISGRMGDNALNVPIGVVRDYQGQADIGDSNSFREPNYADADGDGVSDSAWVKLDSITTSKSKDIYTAIRVIDNCAMLNVNTAYKFDPNLPPTEKSRVDGSSQTQIKLMTLTIRPWEIYEPDYQTRLLKYEKELLEQRVSSSDANDFDLGDYENKVIWKYNSIDADYTPFDISDELELRNRFLLNNKQIVTRLENWGEEFINNWTKMVPVDSGGAELNEWFERTGDPNAERYSYRHLATTYNMDRIITPIGSRMFNINAIDVNDVGLLYNAFVSCINPDPAFGEVDIFKRKFAQLAVNIKDYSDADNDVSVLTVDGNPIYGFENPCVYISELTYSFKFPNKLVPNDTEHRAFAIELFKRYGSYDFAGWRLVIDEPGNTRTMDISGASFSNGFYVIVFEDANELLSPQVSFSDSPANGAIGVDPNVVLSWPANDWLDEDAYDVYFGTDYNSVKDANDDFDPNNVYKGEHGQSYDPLGEGVPLDVNTTYYWRIDDVKDGEPINEGSVWKFTVGNPKPDINSIEHDETVFNDGTVIRLERYVAATDEYINVDTVAVPLEFVIKKEGSFSYKRDTRKHRCIKDLWATTAAGFSTPSLGNSGGHSLSEYNDEPTIQAQPKSFDNVGDVGRVFWESAYAIGPGDVEGDYLIDLTDPNTQRIFKYITVLQKQLADTNRIKGRININTAPWYVIAQLPWVNEDPNGSEQGRNGELARAIVAYRDKQLLETDDGDIDYNDADVDNPDGRSLATGISGLREDKGFENIGELVTVVNTFDDLGDYGYAYSMRQYIDGNDQPGFPDLTTGWRVKGDGCKDDMEERNLIFARISELVTVRSDVFTAYILVRLGRDGPQKRVIAILDRSSGSGVKVLARYEVPDPR
ncbi:MAG: hypothetical protein ACYSSI_01345 [Planctomycetota bacterium]|jgi:hypothetical protein